MNPQLPILFFDNDCLLCSSSVRWLIQKDKNSLLQFAPLRGETAKSLLPARYSPNLNTVILWNQGKIYYRSQAVFNTLTFLEKPWKYLAWLGYFPRPISDLMYRIIARFRKQLFPGKADQCLIGHLDRILP
jgi:predicted DCC family thiol-disulfide oxidoreductase YuxK